MPSQSLGHLIALFTVTVWGTTFIATKTLLESFSPVELLFIRFVIGFVCLWIASPHLLPKTTGRQELTFALAGLCGVTLYFLCENIALTYTMASNVGIIVAISPFFTVLFGKLTGSGESVQPRFFLGFLMAIGGISLLSLNGQSLQLNPLGDLLAAGAAIVWAVYTLLTRKISSYGYPILQTTRHIFFYGIVFMLPAMAVLGFQPSMEALLLPKNLLPILFLGMCASACCYATWSYAVRLLGAVKTAIYIYLIPVITVVMAFFFLQEPITPMSLCGMTLTLLGLLVSEGNQWRKQTVSE